MFFLNNNYLQILLILLSSVLVAFFIKLILKGFVKNLTEKTESHLDDAVLKIITKPLFYGIFLIGLYWSLKKLEALESYQLFISRGFFIIFILIVAWALARIVNVLTSHWLKVQRQFEKTPKLISKIVSGVIYVLAVLMILGKFNVEVGPILGALGIGGLAVGLALQGTLSNFFSGLHIISDRPVKVGDFIELPGNIRGRVEDIGWRSTKIRTLTNDLVIISNNQLSESVVTNKTFAEKDQKVGLSVLCGVGYDSDLEQVEKIVLEVAKEKQQSVEGAIKEFQPVFRFKQFADSNINFKVFLQVAKETDKSLMTHEMIKALKKRFEEEGIDISYPVVKVVSSK